MCLINFIPKILKYEEKFIDKKATLKKYLRNNITQVDSNTSKCYLS